MILDFIVNNLVGIGITIGGVFVSGYLFNVVDDYRKEFFKNLKKKSSLELAKIENEHLRAIVVDVMKYVESQFPELEGDEKMNLLVKKVQQAVPDFILTDAQVKILAEAVYFDIRETLKNFKP